MSLRERCRVIIDLHCHILPNIDDGAENIEETIEMLSIAAEEGIRGMIATSHAEAEVGPKQSEKYLKAFRKTLQYIESNDIPIQIYPGNELYYSEGMISALKNGEAHTINGTRYVLVEFPIYESFYYIERGLRNLQNAGCWPIIAHVERYQSLQSEEKIRQLIELGVYIQINASSVAGKAGIPTRMFCTKLLRKGLVHIVATDAHGSKRRRPVIKDCLRLIDRIAGENYRRAISEENPEKIIKGERISAEYSFK